MPPQYTTGQPALEIIIRSPGTAFGEVVLQCPNLTWNQVFPAIDRLSRNGAVTLTPQGGGLYAVQMSDQASLNT